MTDLVLVKNRVSWFKLSWIKTKLSGLIPIIASTSLLWLLIVVWTPEQSSATTRHDRAPANTEKEWLVINILIVWKDCERFNFFEWANKNLWNSEVKNHVIIKSCLPNLIFWNSNFGILFKKLYKKMKNKTARQQNNNRGGRKTLAYEGEARNPDIFLFTVCSVWKESAASWSPDWKTNPDIWH